MNGNGNTAETADTLSVCALGIVTIVRAAGLCTYFGAKALTRRSWWCCDTLCCTEFRIRFGANPFEIVLLQDFNWKPESPSLDACAYFKVYRSL